MAANYTVSATFMAVDKMSAKFAVMQKSTSSFATRARANFARVEMSMRKLERRVSGMVGKLGKLGLGFGALMIAQQIAAANVEIDQSLASLQAITGATNEEMVSYASTLEEVSKNQKIFGAETGKVFEMVGSAKPELLANAKALGMVSEQAIILSKAGKLEITDSVNALTGSLNQFGKGAEFATKFTDILATAQQKGSGNIQFLSQAMVNAGGTSKAFGNSFADTVAILEGFSKAGVPASEAGTQLAGILAKLSTVQKKEFNPQFTKATDIIDNLSKANLSYNDLIKMTDVRGAKWLTTIINQNEEVQRLTGNLNEQGNAQAQAIIQTSTLGELWKQVIASFKNATTTTDQNNKALTKAKDILVLLADNMDKIIGITITAIKVFVAYKAILVAVKVAQIALSAAMAIQKALQYIAIIQRVTGATKIWAATQWLINTAMAANPVLLIIIGIMALIAAVVLLIVKWKEIVNWVKTSDNWFAKLIRGSLRPLIAVFQLIKEAWQSITAAFREGGIKAGIVQIGKTILNFLLAPIQSLLELIGRIPGVDFADKGAAKIASIREGLKNTETKVGNPSDIITTGTAAAQESLKREERIEKQSAELIIKKEKGVETESNFPIGFPVQLSSTF